MSIFNDIIAFFKYLNIVDIIFLLAIIVLLVLLVTLVYFIKINKDDEDDGSNYINKSSNEENKEKSPLSDVIDKIEMHAEQENGFNPYADEDEELLDLEGLTKKLKEQEEAKKNLNIIESTDYEKEQEEKAIISYQELLKKNNNYSINYEKEEVKDDLVIRKVNLNDLVNTSSVEEIKDVPNVRVISYEKEEAFLSALKELNSLLG